MNTYIVIICYDENDQFFETDVTYASSEEQVRERINKRLPWHQHIASIIEIQGVISNMEVL